jgi:hypothetical protein
VYKIQERTNQALQDSKKSKTEEKTRAPDALVHSISVLRTNPLSSSTFLSIPSKHLAFLSHQRHQKIQRGTISHTFLILVVRHPSPQQNKRSKTPNGITQGVPKMLKKKFQISFAYVVSIYLYNVIEGVNCVIRCD